MPSCPDWLKVGATEKYFIDCCQTRITPNITKMVHHTFTFNVLFTAKNICLWENNVKGGAV